KFEYTNVKCSLPDSDFGNFEVCHLKSVNRTYKYMEMKLNLNQPVTKAQANLAISKRFNGYKPFLYNVSVDFCTFLKKPKSNPVFSYLYGFFSNYSNLNSFCGISNNNRSLNCVRVDKLPAEYINYFVTKVLPVPPGDYMFDTNWYTRGVHRVKVSVYGTLS
ncbi:hypothetical protein KR067_010357, partial [Drosophila pandora]